MFPWPHHFQSQWVGWGLEPEPEIPFFFPPSFLTRRHQVGGGGGQINSSSDGLCGKCGSISKKEGKKSFEATQNGCISAPAVVGPPPNDFQRDSDELDKRRSPFWPPEYAAVKTCFYVQAHTGQPRRLFFGFVFPSSAQFRVLRVPLQLWEGLPRSHFLNGNIMAPHA